MARKYYLALVDEADSTFLPIFARADEIVRSFTVSQSEGDFCALSVMIEKPTVALLSPSRKQWAWLSMKEGNVATPLFFGRIVGLPEDLQDEFVTVEYLAKPSDFEAQKIDVADTLRVAPYWDYAYIDPQRWDDPDSTLENRCDVWHIDRVTHEVTTTSLLSGEDGEVEIADTLIPRDGLKLSYKDVPLRKVNLQMRAIWKQDVKGTLNITPDLLTAFEAAGSPKGFVTSFTGQGLYDDWPMTGAKLGNVYEFGTQEIEVADGKWLDTFVAVCKVKYDKAPENKNETKALRKLKVLFRRWGFIIRSLVDYEAQIERTEDILFTVFADVQNMANTSEDEQSETITLSSGSIGAKVGPDGDTEIPIGDTSRDQFFPLARGLKAIEFGLTHARALLLRRARAAELDVKVPFLTAVSATCRKSASVYHPAINDGVATGKIVSYTFGVNGDNGEEFGSITVACLVGKNTALAAVDGDPTYASDDYVGADWQEYSGRIAYADEIKMTYPLPKSDGVNPAVVGVQSVTVKNGETAQLATLSERYIDIDEACDELNEDHTEVDLRMIPLNTSPRTLKYDDAVVNLSIPRGINLGEA